MTSLLVRGNSSTESTSVYENNGFNVNTRFMPGKNSVKRQRNERRTSNSVDKSNLKIKEFIS